MTKRGEFSFFIRGRSGVSPLIATVLLIAFAVALGAVVLNVGVLYVTERPLRDPCLEVELKTLLVCQGGQGQDGVVNLIVANDKGAVINDLQIEIIGSQVRSEKDIVLEGGNSVNKKIDYDYTSFGPISLIRIIPKVEIKDRLETCSDHIIEISSSEIGAC